ncbi:sulfite exporter TauE/SafE family protein [Pelagibacterium xiamenense]|uniref:sulfite exporter TauE/SafE family protein n=1 Tax=Pelagibacterium xiamenense TaxID=2901140 RepID=UPI001E4A09DB|nr:sulfite exporter TauE/SafE family protein [Pelagibacterium xiamenense]
MSGTAITAIGIIIFGAALLRGLTGFGFALAAVPLMSLVIAPAKAVVMSVFIQALAGLADLWLHRGAFDKGTVGILTLGALIGTPAGVWLLALAAPDIVQIAIGLVVAGATLALAQGHSLTRFRPGPASALPVGALSGFLGGLAGIPGPPAIIYCMMRGMTPATARSTLLVFFFATTLFALPGLAIAGLASADLAILALFLMPVMGAGHFAGAWIFARTDEARYRQFTLIALGIMATIAIAQGGAGALARMG